MVFSLISEGKLCQESFGRKIHLIRFHLNKSDYTEKSWNSFETELKEAKDILAKEAPTQSEVDEAVEHLTAAKNALDKYVYGTANLSYADFYYGELNNVKEDTTLDLTSDKAASYRESGMYDAVSSATTNKYKSFFSSTYSKDNANRISFGITKYTC